ncbi:hypothetical protein JANAI62_07750 [Jannaschia pagri]|uniref:Uncharacterized protein n=1 Tax=Jannaschia pagri TaxID=2829797 RepID=A0ABQ4NJ74_9RHOB|nr:MULTISPECIES: hypothetical protein [unclassified Jannaschia]GIT89740.1 hypothetical protein JANAI61_01980 [Jannaschia sp. AI_61]GIT94152.1 hypothetical protein JANAI62_07750 [Jannaschia sp. AI_62]
MRDFFIRGFEIILTVVLVMAAVGVAVLAIGVLMDPIEVAPDLPPLEGPLMAVVILLAGWLGLLAVGGALFLGLGIYHNTQRTADALELLITLRR